MTPNTPFIINILTLLVGILPVAARSPFGQHNKLNSLPKTVFQHPLAEVNHRNLQTDVQVCEFLLNQGFSEEDRLFCGCERLGDIYQVECRFTDCPDCEILNGGAEETCAVLIEGVHLYAETLSEELYISCVDYESGLFDSTICVFEENGPDTCTVTVNGVPCNSCAFASCDDGFEDYSVDCSNFPGGAVWNFCTADIPETSPFVAFGNNNLFFFDECFDFTASPSSSNSPTEVSSSAPTAAPSSAPSQPPTPAPAPTASPSSAPSRDPSSAPSQAPTPVPPPTSAPSSAPSQIPSSAPTAARSTTPSTVPSFSPSLSFSPSMGPSTQAPTVSSFAPSVASFPDATNLLSPPSGGFHLSVHTLFLVVSAAFVATVC